MRAHLRFASFALLISLPGLIPLSTAQEKKQEFKPKISGPSNEGQLAIQRFKIPQGFTVDLFAAEPTLANPVAFCIDGKNRFYVAETFRLHEGVTDIRRHMDWLDDDLASRTVEDRVKMYRKYLGKKFDTYAHAEDRLRLVEDTDQDGKADKSTVFVDGLSNAAVGIGAGVLAHRGDVYFTCIPDLWLLRDTNGDGVADERKSLSSGYGVHVGFLGHDLHGLKIGPDGKLYFSIGDRGLEVQTPQGRVSSPDTGAVLRCNLDGSDLEIFASGLRNPQELAFDKYGNLFTGDNNSDGGDKARWVYLVEGGDSGWRIGYQFMDMPMARGPWNSEKMWHPQWDGQAAYLLPPIINIADGPSGLAYYPGLGLPKKYDDHFFLADFRGGPANSGIRSFAVKPKGATFELIDSHQFLWSCLPTDVDFGMDGSMYFSDWVNGWDQPGKGRLYRVTHLEAVKDPAIKEVQELMAKGIHTLDQDKLVALLAHQDMRVRQDAQFALAEKESIVSFSKVARDDKNQLARIHAIWGLGQIGRKKPVAYEALLPLLKAEDAEIRAQAAKVLGDGKVAKASADLMALTGDDSARVRFFATMALGKLKAKDAVPAILQMLRFNADVDPYLRHAGVMALTQIGDLEAIRAAAKDELPAVRMASLLAMRRLKLEEIASFLHDTDPRLALEAARAINDVPIESAMDELAAMIDRSPKSESTLQSLFATAQKPAAGGKALEMEPLLYRALNANFRAGKLDNAKAIAHYATRSNVPERTRLEALRMLGEWAKPSGRDKLVGLWRPLPERDQDIAAQALRSSLGGIFRGPDTLRQEAAKVAGKLGIKEVGPALLTLLKDKERPASARVEALRALATLKDKELKNAVEMALNDSAPLVRNEGRRVLASLDSMRALGMIKEILQKDDADQIEKQGAFAILGEVKTDEAKDLLALWLGKLRKGEVAPEIQLDVINAATESPFKEMQTELTKYEQAKPKDDPLAAYRESLLGGSTERGKEVFLFKTAVSCVRCHKIDGAGGEVGPNLSDLGLRQKRDYILESIVHPNKQIAKGFETIILRTTRGKVHTGIVKEQTKDEVRLITAEGKIITVPTKDIDERDPGKSAMPEDAIKYLSRSEVRDLVEMLANQKTKPSEEK